MQLQPKDIILCVDDEMTILNSLKAELKDIFDSRMAIEVAQSGGEALELVDEIMSEGRQISVVISDYLMPEMKGDELLKRIHGKSPDAIKILLTGHASLEGVANAIANAKLYRYIAKPWQQEDLRLTVTEAVSRYCQDQDLQKKNAALQDLAEEQALLIETLKRNEARLQQLNESLNQALQTKIQLERLTREQEASNRRLTALSATDSLTGIANRRFFDQYLRREWEKGMFSNHPLALGLIDIDWFKNYNDCYGHQAGDRCLSRVASFLRESVRREGDLVARYGGEEFVFVCPRTNLQMALKKAQLLCRAIELRAFKHEQSPFKRITFSIGVSSMVPDTSNSAEALIKSADDALYTAKKSGRNQARSVEL